MSHDGNILTRLFRRLAGRVIARPTTERPTLDERLEKLPDLTTDEDFPDQPSLAEVAADLEEQDLSAELANLEEPADEAGAPADEVFEGLRPLEARMSHVEAQMPDPYAPKVIPDTSRLVVVKVYQSGGAAGSYAANCSWTYEVRGLDGTKVLGDTDTTPISPQKARLPTCVYTKAPNDSYGLAFWDDTTLVLLEAYGEYAALVATQIIEDVNYNTTTHKLEYNWRNAYVLSRDTLDDDGDADNLVTTAAACP